MQAVTALSEKAQLLASAVSSTRRDLDGGPIRHWCCGSLPGDAPGELLLVAVSKFQPAHSSNQCQYTNAKLAGATDPTVSTLWAKAADGSARGLEQPRYDTWVICVLKMAYWCWSPQGASPDEVQQKLYQKAMRGSVTDDAQGFATMFPSQFPDLLDISSTPNRLLQANLTDQVWAWAVYAQHIAQGQALIAQHRVCSATVALFGGWLAHGTFSWCTTHLCGCTMSCTL